MMQLCTSAISEAACVNWSCSEGCNCESGVLISGMGPDCHENAALGSSMAVVVTVETTLDRVTVDSGTVEDATVVAMVIVL